MILLNCLASWCTYILYEFFNWNCSQNILTCRCTLYLDVSTELAAKPTLRPKKRRRLIWMSNSHSSPHQPPLHPLCAGWVVVWCGMWVLCYGFLLVFVWHTFQHTNVPFTQHFFSIYFTTLLRMECIWLPESCVFMGWVFDVHRDYCVSMCNIEDCNMFASFPSDLVPTFSFAPCCRENEIVCLMNLKIVKA